MPDEKKSVGSANQTDELLEGDTGSESQTSKVSDNDGLLKKNRELLAEKKKLQTELDGLRAKEDKVREAKLKDEGKLKELVDEKDKRIVALNETVKIDRLRLALTKAGVIDPDYADILKSRIEFDELLNPVGLDEVIDDLKKSKPFLFSQVGNDSKAGVNSQTAKVTYKPNHVFTQREIGLMSLDEWRKNKEEIARQQANGLIR